MPLRPYQEIPVRKAVEFFRQPAAVPSLMVLPTAWGKSWLTAHVARSIPEGDRLLVLQPTKELLEQNHAKYMSLCGALAEAGIYSASFGKKEIAKITYATIGSVKAAGAEFRKAGFTKLLIDEAHLYPRKEESMIGQFLADSGITHVLGITATPLKLETFTSQKLVQKKTPSGAPAYDSKGRPLMKKVYDGYSKLTILTNPSNDGSFYRDIIHVSQIAEMTAMRFWSPLIYDPLPFDPQALRMNSSGSEFAEESGKSTYELNGTHDKIRQTLDRHRERRHVLVFVPTVEEAELLASEYPGSAAVSGKTPKKERERIIGGFRSGDIRVVFNVMVLSTGFDYTKIDMLILGAPTASIARYYQTVGRAVRIDEEKTDALVVDMGGNVQRFGHVEDIFFEYDRIWRMYGTGGSLLSGIPVDCLGTVHREDVWRMMNWRNGVTSFPFGKYRGTPIGEVPAGYLRWYLKKTAPEGRPEDMQLLDKVRIMLECDVRDTTGEPALGLVPSGIHQGKPFGEVPKNYLWWLYRNTRWTPYNDSLRRAVEGALKEDRLFK
ncbi:MAG: DUF3820 family protein [Clostridia bacterium]|nr:DUF3820 family protein [Clostridia bacterium]